MWPFCSCFRVKKSESSANFELCRSNIHILSFVFKFKITQSGKRNFAAFHHPHIQLQDNKKNLQQSLDFVACDGPVHRLRKASLYAKVLSQIWVWRPFASFFDAFLVAVEDVGGRRTSFFKGEILILLLVNFFVQVCLTNMFLSRMVIIYVISLNRLFNI
jgi:hypothetical protein